MTAAGGGLMLAGFLASTTVAWIVSQGAALSFGAIVTAGQVAAWQLKWVSLPVAVAIVWSGSRSLRSIRNTPTQFGGRRIARTGFTAAIVATLLVATLIGLTVPERLRRRQWGIEAAHKARGYALNRALQNYRELHGTLPPQGDVVNHLRTLPDPDGSIAEALQYVDINGYEASTVVAAAAPKTKGLVERGIALRNVSLRSNVEPPTVAFTTYDWRLPGDDKILNNDDDIIIRDGLVMTVPEFREFQASRSSAP